MDTPDRVKKDMVFLKNSWANLAYQEEEEASLLASVQKTDQNIVDEDGFQMKLLKGQKKTQKKLKQTSRDSYATRSKVSHKPLK